MNYRVKRADRAAMLVDVGAIVYKVADSFGCASDDTEVTGIEHVCVKVAPGKPFFTIPVADLEPIK